MPTAALPRSRFALYLDLIRWDRGRHRGWDKHDKKHDKGDKHDDRGRGRGHDKRD